MEYCMTPSSSIYVWKEERPEKPVVATKIEKKLILLTKISLENKFLYLLLW
jgi:hypothetical protein